jgi:hypothetical protein
MEKLAAIRELWDGFVHNAIGDMVPGQHLTIIDERRAPFRDRYNFIQYVPSKSVSSKILKKHVALL